MNPETISTDSNPMDSDSRLKELNKLFFYWNSHFKARCYARSDKSQFQTE